MRIHIIGLLMASAGPSVHARRTHRDQCVRHTQHQYDVVADQHPYDVCRGGVKIGPDATLTIQLGVTVKFENAATNKLNVSCALSAIDTLTQSITFTGVIATPGSWDELALYCRIIP